MTRSTTKDPWLWFSGAPEWKLLSNKITSVRYALKMDSAWMLMARPLHPLILGAPNELAAYLGGQFGSVVGKLDYVGWAIPPKIRRTVLDRAVPSADLLADAEPLLIRVESDFALGLALCIDSNTLFVSVHGGLVFAGLCPRSAAIELRADVRAA